jgi:hypothetical protein
MNDGVWIGDRQESRLRRLQGLSSPATSTKSVSQSSIPGILVFSRRRQLLHMNHRPLELTGHLDQTETGPATIRLSRLVRELRVQVQDTLDSRRKADIWELFELKREMVESGRKILLRGFGLADRNSPDNARIVIVLKEVGCRQATVQDYTSQIRHSIVEEPGP